MAKDNPGWQRKYHKLFRYKKQVDIPSDIDLQLIIL
jgi:hypothetical protein